MPPGKINAMRNGAHCNKGEPVCRPDPPSRRFSPAILHGGIYQSRAALSAIQPWPLLQTSLFCCPSITAQALRAAIVAVELPLRGNLRAEATTVFIDQRILEVVYQCFSALSTACKCSRLFNHVKLELPRARRMGKTGEANRACSAGCLPPTSNPAARAARAVPRPTNFSKRGASRRQTPIRRVRTYC